MTAELNQAIAGAVRVGGASQQVPAPRTGSVPVAGGAQAPAARPESGPAASNPTTQAVSRESVDQAVARLNDFAQNLKRSLNFTVDHESGRTIIKVMDAETKEVIRQIPPEEALVISNNLQDVQGVLLRVEA